MDGLSFRTQICYGTQPATLWEKALEAADSYLDPLFGDGTKAYVTHDAPVDEKRCVVVYSELPPGQILLETVLKVISYVTVVLPLIALALKTVLHTYYQFHLIDAENLLSGNLFVPEEAIAKIKAFLEGQNVPDVSLKQGDDLCQPFFIEGYSDLMFRFDLVNKGQQRLKTAASVIHAHQLDCLEIPKTRFFDLSYSDCPNTLIVQEQPMLVTSSLKDNSHPGVLDSTIDQFMKFARETGYLGSHSAFLQGPRLSINPSVNDFYRFDNANPVATFTPPNSSRYIAGIFSLFSAIDMPVAIEAAQRHGLPFNKTKLQSAIAAGQV